MSVTWSLRKTDAQGSADGEVNPGPATTSRLRIWITAALGIAAIASVDFMSGVELRVFPLYFAPISLVAWRAGRSAALIAAAFCQTP
jgi:hypothetical protein